MSTAYSCNYFAKLCTVFPLLHSLWRRSDMGGESAESLLFQDSPRYSINQAVSFRHWLYPPEPVCAA